MKKTLLCLCVTAAVSAYAADENTHSHQHDEKVEHIGAHVHGIAQLNIVLDGDDLDLMLESPAMNLFGFEHEPATDEQFDQSHKALHTLKDAEWLAINSGDCKVNDADISWKYAEMVHARYHGDKEMEEGHQHEEHKHEEHKHEEHKHEEHKHDEHKHDEHTHEAHHDHDHESGAEHSDVDARFEFHCASPDKVKTLTVDLFEAFPRFEKINVQWVVGDKQGATTLTPSAHQVVLDR